MNNRMDWPLMRRKTAQRIIRENRRRIVERLRNNSRGLVVLDDVHLSNVTAPGPLFILGDRVVVSGASMICGEVRKDDTA